MTSGREVIVLHAEPSAGVGPFAFKGRPWTRVGTTTTAMAQATYERLLLERAQRSDPWENQPAPRFSTDDLDQDEVLRTVRDGIVAGRLPETSATTVPDILDRFGLRFDGQLTQAAVVLFARQAFPHYPQCVARLARFRGTTKDEFIDEQQVRGHAFALLYAAMGFILRHIPIAGTFPEGSIVRKDEPMFPVAALREALVNALIHRRYDDSGGAIYVAIYDDRLEIWSNGGLPDGVTAESLKGEHRSHPRNKTLADVFYRRGLIEQWGRGTQKIVRLSVAQGNPEPDFAEVDGSVVVRFVPKASLGPRRIPSELTGRQEEILHVLSRVASASRKDIREAMANPPSDRTIQVELQRLTGLGLVEGDSAGRGSRWKLRRAQ